MILLITLGILLSGLPFLLQHIRHQRHNRLLALQLRQSLQNMVHCLKVGTSLLQALQRAAEETEDPLGREWKTVVQSVGLGIPLRQALTDLAQRVPLKEMSWFVTAVQISQQTGGSLAGVLETLADTLQERETLREKISALTAQGKASGMLLSTLPFLMMAALYVIAPEFIVPLFTSATGQLMLAAVLVMVASGGVVIYKMVSIRAD